LKNGFRKISRVGSLTGGTKWYLSEDCLLAAKRTMYAAEYSRFYLRDLECIMVWPRRSWRFRLIVPAALLEVLGVSLWLWANSTAGEIFTAIGLAWVALELVLGPTAGSRVRTTGVSTDLALVKRIRRAPKVVAAIDAAILASRESTPPADATIPSLQTVELEIQMKSETASAGSSTADASATNGF
jgi:hypothetical protein